MAAVKVSPKYQIVIPLEVRMQMGIKPGQKFEVLACGDHIHLVPVRKISEMRGAFPGLSTDPGRDKKDRF